MELFIKSIRNYRTIAGVNGTLIKTCNAKSEVPASHTSNSQFPQGIHKKILQIKIETYKIS